MRRGRLALRVLGFGAAVLAPILVVALAIWVEGRVLRDVDPHLTLNGHLTEVAKRAVDLDVELAKMFVGLATAVLGSATYYLRSSSDKAMPATGLSSALVWMIFSSSVLSIFFGHLWLASLRNQLASDYLDPVAPSMLWPERMQYGLFIGSLVWAGILVGERERVRMRRDSTMIRPGDLTPSVSMPAIILPPWADEQSPRGRSPGDRD